MFLIHRCTVSIYNAALTISDSGVSESYSVTLPSQSDGIPVGGISDK